MKLLQNLWQASIALAIALAAIISSSVSRQAVPQKVVPVAVKPTATLSADRTTINKGDSVRIIWAITDAYNVSIAPEIGTVTAQGNITFKPIESSPPLTPSPQPARAAVPPTASTYPSAGCLLRR